VERGNHWHLEALGEPGERRAGALNPTGSPPGSLSVGSPPAEFSAIGHLSEPRPNWRCIRARRVDDFRSLHEHVLGQCYYYYYCYYYYGPRPPLHGDVKRAINDLGNLLRSLNLGDPFGCGTE
jgi:hypothetical protein